MTIEFEMNIELLEKKQAERHHLSFKTQDLTNNSIIRGTKQ